MLISKFDLMLFSPHCKGVWFLGGIMKSAIKKLVKMTKTVKGIAKTFRTYQFFDEYTEEDILKQIEEFDGVVRLCGSIDTYVKFEDGKAVGVYF